MSIAPKELLIPEPQIKKAIDWVVANTRRQTPDEIKQKFTFYSHVGAALANWRQVSCAGFWKDWEQTHPDHPASETAVTAPAATVPAVTVPAVTVPAVTVPAVTVPAVTAPAVTAPAVTAPAVTAPAVTAPAQPAPVSSTPEKTLD
jgi:hypothetical protein